jgi:hypothetical protein
LRPGKKLGRTMKTPNAAGSLPTGIVAVSLFVDHRRRIVGEEVRDIDLAAAHPIAAEFPNQTTAKG